MNKNEFIKELGALLQAADERVSEAVLINEDNVLITFANGYERTVCIAGDSHLAIIKDVVQAIM